MAIRLQKKISRCSHSTSVHMAPNFCWATAVSSARQHAPATDGACHHECGSLDDAKAKQLKQAKKEREQLSIPNTHRRPYKNQTSIMTIQKAVLIQQPCNASSRRWVGAELQGIRKGKAQRLQFGTPWLTANWWTSRGSQGLKKITKCWVVSR